MKTKNLIVSMFMAAALCLSLSVQAKQKVSGQLNLNLATVEQIDQLPGVSPKKALAIVEYRKEHPYKSVDELDNVKGFSPKSIEKVRPYLLVDGPTTFKVEKSASKRSRKAASPETAPAKGG
jgi:competence protein ComEA